MSPFVLLGLISLAFAGLVFSGSDDPEDVNDMPEEPVDVDEPVTPSEPDQGASFDFADNTITIDVGEDETREVVAHRTGSPV